MKLSRPIWYMVFLLAVISACTKYNPHPLEQKSLGEDLLPLDSETLKLKISALHHPLLPSLPFDLRDGLSPDEAALLAVVTNPELRVIRDEKGIASAQVLKAGLLPNPRLGLEYEVPTGGETTGTVNAYTLHLDWEITALLSRSARVSSARAKEKAVDLALAWKEWQVAEAAKLHTLRLLWTERKIILLQKTEKELQKELDLIERAVSLGEKTAVDLAAARATYQKVKLDLENMREKEVRERLALNRIFGFPPNTYLKIQKDVRLLSWPPPIKREKLLSGLAERRLDLLALKMSYQAQEESLRAAVLSQFPRITVGLIRARDTDNVLTTGFGVSIELPFFHRGRARIALEKATRQKIYDEYRARFLSARSDVFEILERLSFVRRKIAASRQSITALERLLSTYKKALAQGNADLLGYYRLRYRILTERLILLDLRQTESDLGVALEIASGVYLPMEVISHAR
ncbi:TolC family protein [Thermosulfurimonas sp. F29]|uniref:TolC family protein n=1 Tax=Thermosulfurimonas sp. F29 TaxID=2867247 RepID=UPI001C82F5BD|nr:TolC family protein [Thermosulfurimonas sp. F29]MBX6422834.1 TolC family protein [Thermosulfurimonas sp. F29]